MNRGDQGAGLFRPQQLGVDALRGATSGMLVRPMAMNVGVMSAFAGVMLTLSVVAFSREG